MRINNVFSGRPASYDRNPLRVVTQYQSTNAPAGSTTRFTYTVPSGRKAMIESVLSDLMRETVAAPVGEAAAFCQVTGGAWVTFAHIFTNAIGDRDRDAKSAQSQLVAGEATTGATSDGSTGGTIEFTLSEKITEFDA